VCSQLCSRMRGGGAPGANADVRELYNPSLLSPFTLSLSLSVSNGFMIYHSVTSTKLDFVGLLITAKKKNQANGNTIRTVLT